ncbi:hypothetical protein X739_00495 [Mesorhizobium sp. LNHC220B00]|nr:M15 family metallopeptidase [Mesorhizobium sp. LNHC220B00]ESY89018.1 hypothetical protein X739_00495 [Mesorhizobium sp. LNHC220B00]
MSDIALSSLRVGADFDASKYKTGADQKIASDRAMVASTQAVGSAFSQADTKISSAGDSLAKLSRQYLDGYKNQERFEQGLRQIGRQLDSGKTDLDGATRLLVGMNQKLGLSADVAELAAKGQTQLAAAVSMANTQIEGQAAALAQAATAHAALIAQARAEQAAENSRQIGAANQISFNNVLGIQTGSSAGARTSASVFEAEFARLEGIAVLKAQQAGQAFGSELDRSLVAGTTKSARDAGAVFAAEMDRIEGIAQLKAAQIGTAFQSDLNASFGIGSGANSARASASVFEEAGREADQMAARVAALRAELNPLAAAQERVNAELSEYSALAAKGAISAEELAQAQVMARNRVAANQNGGGGNAFATMNATSQFQDIAVTAAMGQSPMTIALQQGTQLGMAMQMQMGDQGAKGVIKGLGSAFMGLLSPINLVAIGLTGAAAVAIQYFASGAEKSKALDTSLQKNRESIKALTDAYHMAGVSAEELQRKSMGAAEAAERLSEKELEAQIRLDQKRFTASTKPTDLMTFGALGDNSADVAPEFAAFTDPILKLRKEIDAQAKGQGKANFDDFFRQIDQIANTGPGAFHGFVDELVRGAGVKVETYSEIRDRLYEMGGAAAQAARQLELVLEAQRKIDQENTRPGLQDNRALGRYVGTRNIQEGREQEQFAAEQQMARARTNAERLAAVEAEARAKYPSQADEGGGRNARVEQARQQELTRQQMELKDAQDQRRRSLDQTLASAKLDVDLVGQTTAAVEGLRLAAQLESQVREEAAIKGVKADEAEIGRIKQKAAEYGKLIALQQARDTIHGQEIDLETQKAEVATVGENTLARNRAAAALKTEQDIRKLGIPLYGEEANKIRANTAALSDQAAALAKASLQADLLFERSQILRNSDDQAIASRLQSAGLPIDLNSAEANMMRYNMALQETKDTFKGFATDMLSSLEQGKSLWESFGDAAKNALAKIADKLIDRGLDGIFNNLFGGDQAGGGGLLGSLFGGSNSSGQNGQQQSSSGGSFLSKLFGGGGQSVGSMEVQAAVVNVNGGAGGVGGGLSDILSKLGSPSFKADTTLSDILGYGGAANQNTIQSRIDQAFGTGGSAQDMIQSRIDQAFGTSGGLGGIFSPSGGATSALSQIFSSAGVTKTGIPLSGIGIDGLTAKVATDYAGRFQGLLNDLKGAGYPITSLGEGGYSFRNVAGTNNLSNHAFGEALDINPRENPWAVGAKGNFSQYGVDPSALAQKNGLFWGGNWNKSDAMHFQVDKSIDMETTKSIAKLGTASSQASGALGNLGGASEGLISQFSKMGQSLLSQLTPGTSGSSWFQGLSSMFGGSSGALGYMNSISPAATSDILSGSWGLFDDGGYTGRGGRKEAAGIVHRGEVVWSQDDVARAGGPHVVDGMRRGYGGYADGGIVRSRMHYDGTSSPRQSTERSAANDRPAQNIQQTNNFIFRENPAAPASQNQIAAKSARALERLQRTT